MAPTLKRICKRRACQKAFQPVTHWQRYCTIECGNIERVRKHRRNGKKK